MCVSRHLEKVARHMQIVNVFAHAHIHAETDAHFTKKKQYAHFNVNRYLSIGFYHVITPSRFGLVVAQSNLDGEDSGSSEPVLV